MSSEGGLDEDELAALAGGCELDAYPQVSLMLCCLMLLGAAVLMTEADDRTVNGDELAALADDPELDVYLQVGGCSCTAWCRCFG